MKLKSAKIIFGKVAAAMAALFCFALPIASAYGTEQTVEHFQQDVHAKPLPPSSSETDSSDLQESPEFSPFSFWEDALQHQVTTPQNDHTNAKFEVIRSLGALLHRPAFVHRPPWA
jgi:hypothetical protein